MAEYIGRRIVPTHGGVWNETKEYEELVIVLDEESGDSYISRIPVPSGTALDDEEYWMLFSIYSEQIQEALDAIEETSEELKEYVNTTAASLTEYVQETAEDLTEQVDTAKELTNDNKDELNERMDQLETRLDANVTASTDSDADYAAEVVDARVDAAGETHDSLGEHVRLHDLYANYGENLFADGEWDDITDECGVADGWYSYSGSLNTGFSGAQCTDLISVNAGEIYRVSGRKSNNLYGILLYKNTSDTAPVSYYDSEDTGSTSAMSFADFDVIVPPGYLYMRVQTRDYETQPIIVKKYLPSELDQYKNIPVVLREDIDSLTDDVADVQESFDDFKEDELEIWQNLFSEGEWENITDECSILDGWYTSAGEYSTYTDCQCTELIPVSAGEMYRLSGYASTNVYGVILYAGEDDQSPKYGIAGSAVSAFEDFELIIPMGYTYMRVQTRFASTNPITVKKYIASDTGQVSNAPMVLREDLDEFESDISEYETAIRANILADGDWEDITDECSIVSGWYYASGKPYGSDMEGTQCTELIPVEEGEIYRLSGRKSNNLYGILLYKSEDDTDPLTYMDASVNTSAASFTDVDIVIPNGYLYLRVQTRDYTVQPIVIKKFIPEDHYPCGNLPIKLREDMEALEGSVADVEGALEEMETSLDDVASVDSVSYNKWLVYNAMQQIQGITRNRDYEFEGMSTGLVVLVVDDLRHDLDLVASIIVGEYGFPLCLAAIPANLTGSVDGIEDEDSKIGTTRQEICEYVVENGGEILCHTSKVLTEELAADEDSCIEYFVTTKNALYNAGFTKVNGIIRAGGTGQIAAADDSTGNMDRYCRMYYQYSDYCGYSEPYYHPRKSMRVALDTWKGYVDDAVENKTWFATHFHTLDGSEATDVFDGGFQESNLRDCLEYIKTYVDSGDLEVVTYYDVYNKYGRYV